MARLDCDAAVAVTEAADCCGCCLYFKEIESMERYLRSAGFCRRHVPHLNIYTDGREVMWPWVKASDWCGEFARAALRRAADRARR
jgi:hypothetical protein